MKICDECTMDFNCADCKMREITPHGFEVCQKFQCVSKWNLANVDAYRKLCGHVLDELDMLLEEYSAPLHDIQQKNSNNLDLSEKEQLCHKYCNEYVFEIRPVLQHWVTNQRTIPECGARLYQLISIEKELKKTLTALEEIV